jgi:excisionase family DNA binding protein
MDAIGRRDWEHSSAGLKADPKMASGLDQVENMQPRDDDALLTPSEVAAMFRVNPKTVTRWARAGKISAIRTLGGHRRFRASEIRQFLEQVEQTDQH